MRVATVCPDEGVAVVEDMEWNDAPGHAGTEVAR